MDIWKTRFMLTHYGIMRPHWSSLPSSFKLPDQIEISFDRTDFREAALSFQGSADVGAMLLCALLRSVGVVARLVCSLQPLPFAAVGVSNTPQKEAPMKATVYANISDQEESPASDTPVETSAAGQQTGSPVMPRRIARIGQSRISSGTTMDLGRPPPEVAKTRPVRRPSYPVYWVEAFNEAHQKWIALDLTATMTIGKPSRLEPPFNDPVNCMSYAIAFEDDGSAKDVTRRYAKAYNAKSRKLRVESTEGGQRWFKKAMKLFRKRIPLDRDQMEDAELARKEAAEGMPRNVQDFKSHPYYVLERHLRHNEAIQPMHEVGKVNAGTAASGKLEPVFRRKDVHVVRNADRWYRLGREIKAGEQPLKFGKPRKTRNMSLTAMEFGEEEDAGVALYAGFQTELYIPPPVVRGRVPKNAYGNLDVYVTTMVPPGGVHIRSHDAVKAARLVGVDYAEAVTGFKFQGRQGTAIVEGVVVAEEYQDAVEGVIQGFQDARDIAIENKRSAEALRLWRRFMVGLRVIERMQEYREDDEEEADVQDEIDRYEEDIDEQGGGGFFFEPDFGPPAEPTAIVVSAPVANATERQAEYRLLPDGKDLFGFENVELKSIKRPARRLLALDDDSDEVDLQQPSRATDLPMRDVPSSTTLPTSQSGIVRQEPSVGVDDAGGGFMAEDDESSNGPVPSQRSLDGGGDGGFVSNHDAGNGELASVNEASGGGLFPDHEPMADGSTPNVTAPGQDTNAVLQLQDARLETAVEDSTNVVGPNALGELELQKDSPSETKPHDTHEMSPSRDEQSHNEEDDKGSLLSHDPEDEDAEADWI